MYVCVCLYVYCNLIRILLLLMALVPATFFLLFSLHLCMCTCECVCEFDCLLVVLYFYRNTISLRVYEPHTLVSCTQLRKPFLCQVSRITTMRDDAKARSLSLSAHAANFKWEKTFRAANFTRREKTSHS